MPEYQLKIIAGGPDCMGEAEAMDYAPQWGSYVTAGDPGAVMYGDPADPDTARAMLAHVESDLLPNATAEMARHLARGNARDDVKALKRLANYLRAVIADSEWTRASAEERGFIECLFFMASDDPDSEDGDIHREGGVDLLDASVWKKVRALLANFREAAGDDYAAALACEGYEAEQLGRDLCFTLLGTGVGFTDRDALEEPDLWEAHGSPRVGDSGWNEYAAPRDDSLPSRLERAARQSGYCEGLYRGDSGRLYIWA